MFCSRCEKQPRQANHGWCKPCLAEDARSRYRRLNPTPRLNGWKKQGKAQDHPAYRMVQSARHRAKKKGLDFDLDLFKIEVPDVCPVLGIPLDKRDLQHTPSLDRYDPSKGYLQDNVRVISYRANSIKQDATREEVRAVLEYMS